jgi:hypothetical protein
LNWQGVTSIHFLPGTFLTTAITTSRTACQRPISLRREAGPRQILILAADEAATGATRQAFARRDSSRRRAFALLTAALSAGLLALTSRTSLSRTLVVLAASDLRCLKADLFSLDVILTAIAYCRLHDVGLGANSRGESNQNQEYTCFAHFHDIQFPKLVGSRKPRSLNDSVYILVDVGVASFCK